MYMHVQLGMAKRFTQTFLMYVPVDQIGTEFRILQVHIQKIVLFVFVYTG